VIIRKYDKNVQYNTYILMTIKLINEYILMYISKTIKKHGKS